MLDIDFSNPLDQIRMNVGDISGTWVSDSTINSALIAYNNNVNNCSIAVMEMLCTYFSTLADKEKLGEAEEHFTKLYERYRERLDDFKSGGGGVTGIVSIPILIGGTSKSEKCRVYANADAFSMYDQADWHNKQLGNKTLYELVAEDLEYALHQSY